MSSMRSSKLLNPVGWFEIYVNDLARAGRFYAAVLERPLRAAPNDGTFEALEFDCSVGTDDVRCSSADDCNCGFQQRLRL